MSTTSRSSSNRRRAARHRAVGRDDQRASVEDKLVLATHRVDVDDPGARLGGPRTQDVGAFLELAAVERRRVQVRDDRCADVAVERRAGLPGVLADRQAEAGAGDLDGHAAGAGHERPALVEHPVVRQLALRVASRDRAAAQHRGGVVHACGGAVDEPDDHVAAAGRRSGERIDRRERVVDERMPQDEVLRRVAGDGQFGEDDRVGALGRRARRRIGDALGVAVEVADGGVQLAERDPNHTESLAGVRYSSPPMSTL